MDVASQCTFAGVCTIGHLAVEVFASTTACHVQACSLKDHGRERWVSKRKSKLLEPHMAEIYAVLRCLSLHTFHVLHDKPLTPAYTQKLTFTCSLLVVWLDIILAKLAVRSFVVKWARILCRSLAMRSGCGNGLEVGPWRPSSPVSLSAAPISSSPHSFALSTLLGNEE